MPLNAAIALDIYLYAEATHIVGSGICTYTAGQRMWFPLISVVQNALCSIIRALVVHLWISMRYVNFLPSTRQEKKVLIMLHFTWKSSWSWTSCSIRTNGAHNSAEWKSTFIVASNRSHQCTQMYIIIVAIRIFGECLLKNIYSIHFFVSLWRRLTVNRLSGFSDFVS